MGKPEIWPHLQRLAAPDPSVGAAVGRQVLQKQADEFAAKVLPIIDAIRARWLTTLAAIADVTSSFGTQRAAAVRRAIEKPTRQQVSQKRDYVSPGNLLRPGVVKQAGRSEVCRTPSAEGREDESRACLGSSLRLSAKTMAAGLNGHQSRSSEAV